MGRAFVSVEALLALLAAGLALTLAMPLLSSRPSQALETVYEFQLAQDFAEVGVSNPEALSAIKLFAEGNAEAKAFLEEKFSAILSKAGDYCLELSAKEKVLSLNCRGGKMQGVYVSRAVFDDGRNAFFDFGVKLGFYS